MSSRAIALNHVAKIYRTGSESVEVLRDVNLEIESGSSAVITGESGSGKTTLLNLVGGLDRPDRGNIIAAGRDITVIEESQLTDYRGTTVGFIFQIPYLLRDFTAVENVMMPGYMRFGNRKKALSKASELLEEVNLKSRQNHFPQELSGGERQRVAVARALINDPDLLLADEPTGNLDEMNSRSVEDLIFMIVESLKKTLILVTHDENLATRGSSKYRLAGGELHSS